MSTELDGLGLNEQANHFQTNQQTSLSDGEEEDSKEFEERRIASPKMQKRKNFKAKRGRNYSNNRSLTDPNLKNLSGITVESTISDSTPNVSKCSPNLPPTGLTRSKSPRPLKSSKAPSSDQIFNDNPDPSGKSGRSFLQLSRPLSRIAGSSLSTSLLPSSPTCQSPTFSIFKQNSGAGGPDQGKKGSPVDRAKSKMRLSSLSSCPDQESAKTARSPVAGPFGKMKSFKDGLVSPESGKNKFPFHPNYSTVSSSSKKNLARLRNYSLPSEHFTLKFDAEDPGTLIPSPSGQTLEQAIQTSVTKRGLTMNMVEVYLDSSKTPLPKTSDTFLLANSVLWVKVKENSTIRSSDGSSHASRKRQSSLTRLKKILNSAEDLRTNEESQKVKVGHKGRLHSLLGSFTKHQDKQDQLHEFLNFYSRKGLPKMPDLLTLGRPTYDAEDFKLEKHWTEVVDPALSSKMGKHERDQQEALWELLTTEVEYIEKLQVITDLFVCCLINLQNDLIMNEIEVDKLCSNVVDVYYASCHFWTAFLSEVVKTARDSGSPLDPTKLKQGFLLFDKIFEPYKKYCLEQEVCRDYIKNRLKDNELFRLFIQWAESQPQCKRLKLTDLIISPFQRLTRYKLFLYAIQRPIVRHLKAATQSDDGVDQSWQGCHKAKEDIDVMVEQVERFVNEVNVAMRLSQDHQQLSLIVDKIEAYEVVEQPNEECAKLIQKFCNLDLTMPMHGCGYYDNRCLVLEGGLKLKDANNKFDVHCYLFTDLLLITRSTFKKSDKVKFKVIKPPMRLDKIVAHELKDGGNFMVLHLNEFHLVQSALLLFGDSKLWVESIVKAQKEYKEKRKSFSRKSNLSHVIDLPLHDDRSDLAASKGSNPTPRSASVSESLKRDDPSPTSSRLNLRLFDCYDGNDGDYYECNDDDDDGMFSAIIKFAAKRSVSQQTSDGLAKRSLPRTDLPTSHPPLLPQISPLRRNKSTADNHSMTAGASLTSDLRSRSSDDVTPAKEMSLPVCGLSRQEEAQRRMSSTSKSLPDVTRGGRDDDEDENEEEEEEEGVLSTAGQSEERYGNDRANGDEDDVSVFFGSFRTRERDFDP